MANQGNRAAWPSNDDFTFLSLVVLVIGVAFFGWLAWTSYHGIIAGYVGQLAHWQIVLIQFFTTDLDQLDDIIRNANDDAVTVSEIFAVLNATGLYLRIPAIAIILGLATLCFTRAAPSRFTRPLDLGGLVREQARFFRPLAAYAARNLRLVPVLPNDVRPADPALHAREWAARYAAGPDGTFDPAAARRAFVLQLGPLWRGVKHAPDHVRFLYAVFALHLDQQRSEAQELLGDLAEALPPGTDAEPGGPVRSYPMPAALVAHADMLLRAYDLRASADVIAARHAYATTALMSVLTEARRRSGVLAPAQFACLKLIDRGLWYALHSLGFEGDGPGQTTHPNPRVEAAGARDHWAAERLAGGPLIIPSVDRAIDAVRAALDQNAARSSTAEAV